MFFTGKKFVPHFTGRNMFPPVRNMFRLMEKIVFEGKNTFPLGGNMFLVLGKELLQTNMCFH